MSQNSLRNKKQTISILVRQQSTSSRIKVLSSKKTQMVSCCHVFIHEFNSGFKHQQNYWQEMFKLHSTKLSVVTLQCIMKSLPGVNVFLPKLNYQEQKRRSKKLDESHVLRRKSDLC